MVSYAYKVTHMAHTKVPAEKKFVDLQEAISYAKNARRGGLKVFRNVSGKWEKVWG